MNTEVRWGLTIVAAVLVGLVLVALYAELLAMTSGLSLSNGERIYFTAASNSGQPIIAEILAEEPFSPFAPGAKRPSTLSLSPVWNGLPGVPQTVRPAHGYPSNRNARCGPVQPG